jgi:uncharacterized protein YkwD
MKTAPWLAGLLLATGLFLALAVSPVSARANLPSVAPGDAAAFLKVHNDARAAKGIAPLKWNADCAAAAQAWADHLARNDLGIVHSGRAGYGENIFEAYGGNFTDADAARHWLGEITKYHGQALSQANYPAVGHYTQMVWSRTTGVGSGIARSRSGKIYIVGVYSPPGNRFGETPYRKPTKTAHHSLL